MKKKSLEAEREDLQKQLSASYALSGYLLEAYNEEAAILAAMKVSTDLLGAEGAAFVPFNEWTHSMPAVKYGRAEFLQNEDWQKQLFAPVTRHACRICEQKQAGSECVLLHGQAQNWNIFCVGLRCGGREIGVLSYFFSESVDLGEGQHSFLDEMVRLTDLTLSGLRVKVQEVEAARLMHLSKDFKEKLFHLDAETEELLEQIEYKAMLDERTRLAREIHDGLAQTLAFLKMEAARMQTCMSNGDVEAVSRSIRACTQTLSDAYLDARQAIDNLRRVPNERLADWLELTATEFSTLTGIEADVSNVHLVHVFSPTVKAQLVRIVQEALTNVRKHAQALRVTVKVFESEETVILEVRDDGRGFTPEETQPTSQYGLRSMRERAESISADFQIISSPGTGTTVRLCIPIKEKASL